MALTSVTIELDETGHPVFNEFYLKKWARLIKIRDSKNCIVCGHRCQTKHAKAHHIFPKEVVPELAYMLWNGVACCPRCHTRVISSSKENISRYRVLFWPYMCSNAVRSFNNTWQYKLTSDVYIRKNFLEKLKISPRWRS